ncbi:hypothetical protein TIFTF001_040846 [Ficus carica]|uniref:Uncharacterized protein n=1 Tax=Ficus carica TaxID=3494 RepID=A0AA87ZHC7_FICCA|nr:hypothetical protein TIFTF001_040846 [Ficus carica]
MDYVQSSRLLSGALGSLVRTMKTQMKKLKPQPSISMGGFRRENSGSDPKVSGDNYFDQIRPASQDDASIA